MTTTPNTQADPATEVLNRLAGIVDQVMVLADEVVAIAAEATHPHMVDDTVHALRADSDAGLLWARLYLAGHRSAADVTLALAEVLRIRGLEASRNARQGG